MNFDNSVFKRYEKKYIITRKQLALLISAIRQYIEPDEFHQYTISNIYYDTQNYALIRRSIEKPVYKEKLRIRTYGESCACSNVFIELKKKYKKEVFKRRVSVSTEAIDSYLGAGSYGGEPNQILNEIHYFMSLYNPVPKIFIAYERSAFTGIEDKSLRITFDENIRFRTNDLDFKSGTRGTHILDDELIVMEIKIRASMPLWLSHALNGINIYPSSFSKYGRCYTDHIVSGKTASGMDPRMITVA